MENISVLLYILSEAGYIVRVGSLLPDLTGPRDFPLPSGETVTIEPVISDNNVIKIEGFIPDVILLNNDLSSGIPEILQHTQQPIVPPAELGWSQR